MDIIRIKKEKGNEIVRSKKGRAWARADTWIWLNDRNKNKIFGIK